MAFLACAEMELLPFKTDNFRTEREQGRERHANKNQTKCIASEMESQKQLYTEPSHSNKILFILHIYSH